MGQTGSQEQGASLQQQDLSGGVAGPSQPPAEQRTEALVVPTVLQWSTGGTSVFVTGSFNNWGERIPLRRSGADYVVCLNLLPGTYQYKFIVDSEWRFAPDQPTVRDEMGNINNCITVEDQQMYLHEDPCSGFFGDNPNNPNNAYTQVPPDESTLEITLAKEPPLAPVHLTVVPLNVTPMRQPSIASWSLQPPLSVTLQHMCIQRSESVHVTALSTTQRFRSKFVTIVIYKPVRPSENGCNQQQHQQRESWMGKGAQPPRGMHQQLAPQPGRVSWSDGQVQPMQQGNDAHGVHFAGPGYIHQPVIMQPPSPNSMMPPPPPRERSVNSPGGPYQGAVPEFSHAESMDLGSRPSSQSANMDTCTDWQ